MEVQFIASVSVITQDLAASRALYVDALGLPLEHAPDDDYLHSEQIGGSRHFGVWPLGQAAQACFGTDDWPAGVAVPQASVEFEVAVDTLLHGARLEPWGQTVARLLSPEGLVVGLSHAPWLHG
jgi:catechol 2,3-dioxygenase-like lactoylglutathione lyase family enzyme